MSSPAYLSEPQIGEDDQNMYTYNGKVMILAVATLLVVSSLVLLLHVYAKWWFIRQSQGQRWSSSSSSSSSSSPSSVLHLPGLLEVEPHSIFANDGEKMDGLDASVVASLPIFVYKTEECKNGLECVVCLSTLVDDDKGKILPMCQHVFHGSCIDKWLLSHSTCPICRARVAFAKEIVLSIGTEEVSQDPPQISPNESDITVDENSCSEIALELPLNLILQSQLSKDSSPSSSSSSSTLSSSSSSSPSSLSSLASSSLSCSLRRVLSRNRLEGKVFPSVLLDES